MGTTSRVTCVAMGIQQFTSVAMDLCHWEFTVLTMGIQQWELVYVAVGDDGCLML